VWVRLTQFLAAQLERVQLVVGLVFCPDRYYVVVTAAHLGWPFYRLVRLVTYFISFWSYFFLFFILVF
jgi:hypothetical protein